jgi:hypothetical protein
MAVMDMFAPVKGKPAVVHPRPPWPTEGNPRENEATEPKEVVAREAEDDAQATIAKARAANPGKRVVVAG